MDVGGYADVFWDMRDSFGLCVSWRRYAFLEGFMRELLDLCAFGRVYEFLERFMRDLVPTWRIDGSNDVD